MAHTPRSRVVAAFTAAILTGLVAALVPGTASAATTSLFNQPFHNPTADGDGAVVLPAAASSTVTNVACLTAAGNTTTVPKSCTTNTDPAGSGKLRLTDNTTSKAGGLFAATSVPTSQGLDITFNTYQYGTSSLPADGIAFALAAVDPTNPLSPANMGPVGGSLGYSYGSGTKGLAYGYLGIGFDVYGNFSNSSYQGTNCAVPAYISTTSQVKGQVVIKGPGNNSTGYCAINSTATSTSSPALALRASTRAASKVPVEVVINPGSSAITSPSGISVAAKGYAVQFTPVGGTARTLSGALPTVSSTLYPSSYLDASGYPKQLAFGWVGSTGSLVDFHEVDEAKIVSLSAVPELTVAQTAYSAPAPAAGDPVSYVVKAGVAAGVDENSPISVTDTLPNGVTPTGGYGSGWTCATPVGQKITCTSSTVPTRAGASLPNLTITGTVTGSGLTATSIANNSIVTASSNDANPAYSSTAATAAPTSAPSNLVISPSSGPTGTAVSITGTNTASATAVQIGTSAEIAAGTAATYTQCPGNTAANGCFTINNTTGAIGITAMPTHSNGAVQVKVVALGSAGTVTYTYTSVPGTPTVTASAGVQSATASWSVPATGGSAITGYVVVPYKNGVPQLAVTLGAGATTYTVGNATPGASYTFTVAAINLLGTGVASLQSNAAVPYTVPGAPTAVTATAGTSAARLTWTAPSDTGFSPITGYVVTPYLNGVAQSATSFDSTDTSQTVTGLTPGKAYTFTVAARNAAGTGPASSASTAVTVNAGPSITTTPGRGEVGAPYSQQLAVAGGTAPYTFTLTDGALPDGLTLSGGGLISGTPTAAGSSTVTVKVTDSYGASATKTFTLVVVAAPSLTFTPALPSGTVGVAYTQALSYSGGTGPYTFSVVAGKLPAGLSLDASTGTLTGTPTASGDSSFTVKIIDALGQSDTRAATLAVRTVPDAPTGVTATAGTAAARVSWTAPANDGNSPVTGYVVTHYLDGVVQASVSFASTRTTQTISGLTPGRSYTFIVAAINSIGTGPGSAASTAVTVNPGPTISSTPGDGEVGAAYNQQLSVAGGTGPYTFTVSDGTLPAGLDLSSGGLLSGTPTAAGTSTFTLKVSDSYGASSTKTVTLVVVPAPSLTYGSRLPAATVGTAYSQVLTRAGGTGPFTYSVSAGTLPEGLALDSATGVLSGTPTRSGDATFTVKVVDALGQSDTRVTTLAVRTVPSAPQITEVTAGTQSATLRWGAPTDDGNSPVTGYVVTPYLNDVAQTPVVFGSTATSQTLTGLSGGGSYTFTVAAVNAVGTGPGSARSAAVVVNDRPGITNAPGVGEVGVAYDQQLVGTGGTGALTFDLASGSLPDGLVISALGRISGTPTQAGSFTFKARVTDATGSSSTKSLTIDVRPAPSLSFDSDLPDAERGKAYSTVLTSSGGTGPFVYSVSAGTLPDGLTLDPGTGTLAGTPTRAGSHTFTVKVVDALGASDTKVANLLVKAPADVALAVSATTVGIDGVVRLTSTLDPSSSTGTVTFRATRPDGTAVDLGSDTVSGGTASISTTLPRFGRWTVVAVYGGDATHLGASSAEQTVEVAAVAGEAIITEFRTSGPNGAEDSYAEIYNTGAPLPLAGFTLVSGSGEKTVLPADAPVLGRYRTYLVVGRDFSLGQLASPDQTGSLGTGGLQLVAPDTAATVTDAVGPDKGPHLGKALPVLSGTPTSQWAFVRVEKAGRPVNSGQNAADFALVSSDGGKVGGVQSMRGSASPTGLKDDWQHDEQAQSYLLDPTVSADAVPNRPYVVGKPGTLEIRRTITNTGTSTITSAKARVTALSEANGLPYYGANPPATPAAIRAVNPKTATSKADVKGRGTVTVQNLKVDAPITAAAGGGLNSTFTIPLPDGGLAPGASVDVAFTFEVDVRGTFWFGYDVDARTADQAAGTASKTQAKVSTKTVERRLAATGKTTSQAVAPLTRGSL